MRAQKHQAYFTGGVVEDIEIIEGEFSLIKLEPLPGSGWTSSSVPVGIDLTPNEFIGKQVDIKTRIQGRGARAVIAQVIEFADSSFETEMPYDYFRQVVERVVK